MLITQNELQYLSWIYVNQIEKKQKITPAKLVKLSATKPSSVTEMIQKLAKKGLIIYQPYHQVFLSEIGVKAALKEIRFKRLWNTFLAHNLELNWKELHQFSQKTPQYSSELEEKIDKTLNFPRLDPFGGIIPNNKLQIIPQNKIVFKDLKPNESFQIIGIVNDTEIVFNELDQLKIYPKTIGKVKSSDIYTSNTTILISKEEIKIPKSLQTEIWVKKTNSDFSLF